MPRKSNKKNGRQSNRRSFAPAGFFTAPDGKHYPLNGADRTTALYRWKRGRRVDGGAPPDSGIGGETSVDTSDGGDSVDDSNLGGSSDGGTGADSRSDGRPRIIRRRPSGKRRGKAGNQKELVGALDLEADEDLAKLNALVVGCFEMAVVVRQCPVWAVSAEDALRISRPLNDCLKQYPQVAEKLLNIAPPVALGIGLASTIGPRVIADKVWHDMNRKPPQAPVGSNPPPEQQPSVPYVTVPSDHKGTETGFPKDLESIRAAYEAANPPEVRV